ncbi:MAG TPA: hypothetical protein HPP83_12495 [Candidatus Hydrogenedentes bacterium]|nr:hypothetical protein [Candidatus Hydrogenedentota bacterium]
MRQFECLWVLSALVLIVAVSAGASGNEGMERQIRGDMDMTTIENSRLSLGFDLGRGVELVSIVDHCDGHDYLGEQAPEGACRSFLAYYLKDAAGEFTPYSGRDHLEVTDATVSKAGDSLHIEARAVSAPLTFVLTCVALQGETAAICSLRVRNEFEEPTFLKVEWPLLQWIDPKGDPEKAMGAVPIEIGGFGPLHEHIPLKMGVNPRVGQATAFNSLNVGAIFDPAGRGGLFLAAVDAAQPLQLVGVDAHSVVGNGVVLLHPHEEVTFPRMAIGVHDGDWRKALDYYRENRTPRWAFPNTPAWLRDAGAVYSTAGVGAGAIYMTVDIQARLKEQIGSFDNLPRLLEQARGLGTDVVYVVDHYGGLEEGGITPYMNKGDYVPRGDMGGPEAFRRGIAEVHKLGGRVVVYVEPFIVYPRSQVGKANGEAWSIYKLDGTPYEHYRGYFSMDATNPGWQAHLAAVAHRLVAEYGVDGIYLDSYGWQCNWPFTRYNDPTPHSGAEWNQGVLDTLEAVRRAVRSADPDAVVMTESYNDFMHEYVDGGLDASFAWLRAINDDRIVASPIRYAMSEANVFSNGRDINGLNQVFAAGHNLALDAHWLPHADYVRRLVQIRKRYKDALVSGAQAYQPKTESDAVAAYFYQGAKHQIITAVNIGETAYEGRLVLRQGEAESVWRALLTDETITTNTDPAKPAIPISIPGKGLRVLVRHTCIQKM